MIASALTARRLLNRLPPPRRGSLQDLGHAAALIARAGLATEPHEPALAERIAELRVWIDTATTAYARPTTQRSTTAP